MKKIFSWWTEYRRLIVFTAMIMLSVYGAWELVGKFLILGCCAFAIWYTWTYRKDLAETQWQDWINPVKWASVVFGLFTKMLFPMHILEQIILRAYDKECNQCFREGKCFACGCDSSKMYVPWEECFKGNWGGMYEGAKEYREMRREFPIQIDVRHLTEEAASKGYSYVEWTGKDGQRHRSFDTATKPENMSWEEWFELIKSAPWKNIVSDPAKDEGPGFMEYVKSRDTLGSFLDFAIPEPPSYELLTGTLYPDNEPPKTLWRPIGSEEINRLGGIEFLIREGFVRVARKEESNN